MNTWSYDATMETSRPSTKRKRLSHACTRCRSKKIRCDELEPNCTNCVRAGVECVTFDPRTLTTVRRRGAQSQPVEASPSTTGNAFAQHSNYANAYVQGISPPNLTGTVDDAESPAVSSPLLPVLPRFLNGNSLSVLTQWLDLTFARLGMTQRLHHTYNNIRASEQRLYYTGLTLQAGDMLPPYAKVAADFSTSMGWLFPIVEVSNYDDAATTMAHDSSVAGQPPSDLAGLSANHSAPSHSISGTSFGMRDNTQNPMSRSHPTPLQALVYAVSATVDASKATRALAARCFGYAFSRLPAILEGTGAQAPNSIRALVLMSLYLRWRDDVEKAWQILALAVASVHNQSLHREHHRAPLPGSQELFWSVFVLDKLLSIELERKPMLPSTECNRTPPLTTNNHNNAIFKAIVDLSILQDEILEKMQSSRRSEEEAHAIQNPTALHGVIKDKLRLVDDLDQKLLQFASALPDNLKPTEYLYADPQSLPGLTFFAVQYHQAVFLVSRNALLINMQAVQSEIDRSFEGLPSTNRLRSGMKVCANAARSILNVLNHAEEMGVRSLVLTPYAPLMAMYALTIHIVRRQSPATARVDLELQATAMDLIRSYNSLQAGDGVSCGGEESGLLQMLGRLHDFSESYVHRSARPKQASDRTISLSADTGHPAADLNSEQRRSSSNAATRVMSPPQSPANQLDNSRSALAIDTILDNTDAQGGLAMSLSDFSNDWLMDMGQDALAIDWDELALALGLPAELGG